MGLCLMVQVIARIHTTVQPVRRLIHNLLVRIGKHHPQALMYPLLVACKSQSSFRRQAAMSVVDAVRQHSATLVEQAQLVCLLNPPPPPPPSLPNPLMAEVEPLLLKPLLISSQDCGGLV